MGGHWHVPRSWTLLHASGAVQAAEEVWNSLPPDIGKDLEMGYAQLLEICRSQAAFGEAAVRVKRVLPDLELDKKSNLKSSLRYYLAMNEVCKLLEQPGSSFLKAQRLWTVSKQAFGHAPKRVSKRHGPHGSSHGLFDGMAQVVADSGLDLSFPLLGSRPKLRLGWRPPLLLMLSAVRSTELAADRAAAEALGSIEPVVAALARLHGNEADRRRIARGDVHGFIDGACEALAARGGLLRWEMWWISVVQGLRDPPLVLRVADLAAWAELGEEGRLAPWRRGQPSPGLPFWEKAKRRWR